MEPILISACLLGAACRYDGGSNPVLSVEARLHGRCQLVPVCPEQLGGLPTPREPAERTGGRRSNENGSGCERAISARRGSRQLARIFGCKGGSERAQPQLQRGRNLRRQLPGARVPGEATAQLLKQTALRFSARAKLRRFWRSWTRRRRKRRLSSEPFCSEYCAERSGGRRSAFCARACKTALFIFASCSIINLYQHFLWEVKRMLPEAFTKRMKNPAGRGVRRFLDSFRVPARLRCA